MASEKFLTVLEKGKEDWNIWYNSKLRGLADLRGVNFACTDFTGINFTGAMLQDADLRYTNFTDADLRGANLTGARLERAILYGANLQDVIGLTPTQLHYAEGDGDTKLPEDFEQPIHWSHVGDK